MSTEQTAGYKVSTEQTGIEQEPEVLDGKNKLLAGILSVSYTAMGVNS